MDRIVVLVNGVPASGKTTLARGLARRLRLPLFSKDVIKEAHAEVFGAQPPDGRPQREWNRLIGTAANSTMWELLADSVCGAVLESTWPAGETWEFVQAGLSSAQVERPLQIWCEVPLAVARERYALRHPSRHPVHGDPPDDAEWEQRWALAEPLPIHDTLRVDTVQTVDWDMITGWCERCSGTEFGGSGRTQGKPPLTVLMLVRGGFTGVAGPDLAFRRFRPWPRR